MWRSGMRSTPRSKSSRGFRPGGVGGRAHFRREDWRHSGVVVARPPPVAPGSCAIGEFVRKDTLCCRKPDSQGRPPERRATAPPIRAALSVAMHDPLPPASRGARNRGDVIFVWKTPTLPNLCGLELQ